MIWGQFHSATISVDAFGETLTEVVSAMTEAWTEYARKTNQDPGMLAKNAEKIVYKTVGPKSAVVSAPRPAVRESKRDNPGPHRSSPDADDPESV